MMVGSKLQAFISDPYKFVDELDLSVKGNNLNYFAKFHRIQKIALYGSIVAAICWVAFGFDSTPLQFVHVLYEGVPALIQGQPVDLMAIYNLYYGKEMHYSAFVIYGLLFYLTSKNFERVGIEKSKNMVFSFAVMFGAISVFEFFWIIGFATFQNQPWVFTWRMPQLKILLQNTVFGVASALTYLYMITERYWWDGKKMLGRRFYFDAKNWKLWFLVGLSVASALFWVYYPGNVHQISVPLETGEVWQSSRLFPQTLYTVDLNPVDGVNAGEWFWVEDNWVHLVNTIVKVIWAATAYYVFRVKKKP
jgi:hypothetical protein